MMGNRTLSTTVSGLAICTLLVCFAGPTPVSAASQSGTARPKAAAALNGEKARPFADSSAAVHRPTFSTTPRSLMDAGYLPDTRGPKAPADTIRWTWTGSGLGSYYVNAMKTSSSGRIFAGTDAGIYYSTNGGSSWSYYGLSSYGVNAIALTSSGDLIAGTSSGLRFTTNGGSSWWYVLTSYSVYSVAIGPSGYIYAGTSNGVWYSSDGGSNFNQIGLSGYSIWSLAVNSSGYIFAGSSDGINRSTDGGSSWYYWLGGYAIYSLSINSSGYIFAGLGSSGGMYSSTDGGSNWAGSGLSGYSVYSSCVTSSGAIAAGTGGGIDISTDAGANWTYLGSAAGHVAFGITSYSGRLYAGTYGYGIYSASLGPPAPALAFPGSGASGVATSLLFDWTESSGATSYRLQVSGSSTFSTTVVDKADITGTLYAVYGFARSTTYYWHVSASNATGTGDWSATRSFTTFTYPSSISLSRQYYVPANLDSSGYRIFGVPGGDDIPLSDVFSGTEGPDWTAYYDNGSSTDYMTEYDGSDNFHFRPGAAFWILSKNSFSISRSVSPVSLDDYDGYRLPLHPGWNLISDPFESSVPWLTVQAWNITQSWTPQPIWSYDGSYHEASSLDPYAGYYFYNDGGVSSIEVPYGKNIQTLASGSGTSIAAPRRLPQRGMTVDASVGNTRAEKIVMSLSGDSTGESSVTVGFDGSADGHSQNILSPPGDFESTRICVVDNSAPSAWKEFVEAYRDSIGAGQQFDFYVKNKERRSLSLQLSVDPSLANYQVCVLDRDLRRSYDVRAADRIEIPSFNTMKHYSLLVGSGAYVDQMLTGLVPRKFELYQNYPNPFNPVTVIRFQVPRSGHVSLAVYDILGRKVGMLMNAVVQPGYYEVPFDGTSLSSGVYFYRLNTGNSVQTRKMVLMK